jgi:anaerobic selenocysteine-containing dehydrogenase
LTRLATTCNRDCPDACAIDVEVEGGRALRLSGGDAHPVTRGFLCRRTSRFLERQYDPDRLLSPLLRRGEGFVPIGWEEALDLCAENLLRFRRESGPASIFHYRSGGSLGLLKHLVDHFFERFGPVTMKRGDICSGAGDWAQETDFGHEDANDLFDLRHARAVLLWGKNPFVSNVHLLPLLLEARGRGVPIALIDPVRQRTGTLADLVLQPRPGGDFALAMGVARTLFEEGLADPGAERWCEGLDAFRAMAFSRDPGTWAREADVAPGEVAALARLYGANRPASIQVGWGLGRRSNGAGTIRALDALGAVTGNVGVPGGGVSYYFRRRGAFDLSFLRGLAAAPRSILEPLLASELPAMRDPPVRMVWVTAGNPVAMLPDSRAVAAALASREFTVVVDSFLTDTARAAHLVLPTTTLLEEDDLVGAYGHHWLGEVRPVLPRPEGVRSDLEIVQALARRVGLGDALEGSPEEWKRRLLSGVASAGASLEELRKGAVRNPRAPRVLFEGRRFPTPSGRVRLVASPPPALPPLSPEFPLYLMAISTDRAQGSQTRAAEQDGPLEATVHPLAAPGTADGGDGLLETRRGSLAVRVRHDPGQRRDVVLVPKGGWLSRGRCANALIAARATDAGEGAAYYDEPARLRPRI